MNVTFPDPVSISRILHWYDSILARKTTKDDENNHGLGIDIIDHTVKQLNGTYEYRYENGHIILDIYI